MCALPFLFLTIINIAKRVKLFSDIEFTHKVNRIF